MATVELRPDESYEFEGVKIDAVWDSGDCYTFVTLDGWKKRGFDLEIDSSGGHVDALEFDKQAPSEENARALAAIAIFARQKAPEVIGEPIITVEDYYGNLL